MEGTGPGNRLCTALNLGSGGAPKYREKCDEVAACGYPGFTFR
jgi:hypothetical protein